VEVTHVVSVHYVNRSILARTDQEMRMWPGLIRQQDHAPSVEIKVVEIYIAFVMRCKVVE
jgi:hypothetical protein